MINKQGGSLSSLSNEIAIYKRGILKLSNKLEDLLPHELDIREELEETIKDYKESIKKLEEALKND
jgi:predicted  nucleic acid-binding Zn-ribbon protein